MHKLEFLALKWAVADKFHDFLYGNKVHVLTDNNPLTYVLNLRKFAERENLKQTKFIKTMGELLDMFRDSAINVKDLIIHNEDVIEVHFNNNDGFVEHNVNTNIIVASFTTALARLKLYTVLEQLDDRVLYHDTDSVVFRTDSTVEHLDPSTGGTFSVSSPTKSMTPGKNSYKLGCVRMVRERKITRDVKTKTVHTTIQKRTVA